MEVVLSTAHGYCAGVTHALKLVKKALDNPETKRPIYILGNIIHNDLIAEAIKEKGAVILEGKSRYDMLDDINEGTVIFSAHGVADSVYEKAVKKGLNIIDATCPVVLNNKKKIKMNKNEGNNILFIGKKNHPETEGMISDDPSITLISSKDDINDISIDRNKKYYCINQTTLSIYDIEEIKDYIEKNYNNITFENSICMETTKRQMAVLNVSADIAIVCGSKKSSNTSKLTSLLERQGIKTYQVDSVDDLENINLENINKVFVTSGASTPEILTKEIVKYLETKEKSSHNSDDLF